MVRLVGADDIGAAVQQALQTHLPQVVEQLELSDQHKPVTTWTQVPTLEALQSAAVPAGAVSSPGVIGEPVRRGDGRLDATWRVAVGVYDRAGDFTATADRARSWAKLIRAAVLADRTLGGLASHTEWRGESYAQVPQSAARTLGACAVAFDVTVDDVLDLDTYTTVTTTHQTVTARSRVS